MPFRLMMEGDIKPVNFKCPKSELFTLSFYVGSVNESEKINRLSIDSWFSVTPGLGNTKLIGRIRFVKIVNGITAYDFLVDEIRISKRKVRQIESFNASKSR